MKELNGPCTSAPCWPRSRPEAACRRRHWPPITTSRRVIWPSNCRLCRRRASSRRNAASGAGIALRAGRERFRSGTSRQPSKGRDRHFDAGRFVAVGPAVRHRRAAVGLARSRRPSWRRKTPIGSCSARRRSRIWSSKPRRPSTPLGGSDSRPGFRRRQRAAKRLGAETRPERLPQSQKMTRQKGLAKLRKERYISPDGPPNSFVF